MYLLEGEGVFKGRKKDIDPLVVTVDGWTLKPIWSDGRNGRGNDLKLGHVRPIILDGNIESRKVYRTV